MDYMKFAEALNDLSKGWDSKRVKYDNCLPEAVVPVFILECKWGCNTAHMVDKFNYHHKVDGRGWLLQFFNTLDGGNREAFVNWVVEHYMK